MKRWIHFAAGLYPSPWPKRYGTEFQALLEDVNPGYRELFDVFKGALKMRLATGRTYLKSMGLAIGLALGTVAAVFVKHTKPAFITAGLGLFGCIVGFAISFYIPQRYVSQAVLRISPRDRMAGTSEGQAWLVKSATKVSRESGAYPNDLAFHIVSMETAPGAPSTALQIHYADSDPKEALHKLIALMYKLRAESSVFEVVDAASFPASSVSKTRTISTVLGLALGMTLALILNARRAPVRLASEPHE